MVSRHSLRYTVRLFVLMILGLVVISPILWSPTAASAQGIDNDGGLEIGRGPASADPSYVAPLAGDNTMINDDGSAGTTSGGLTDCNCDPLSLKNQTVGKTVLPYLVANAYFKPNERIVGLIPNRDKAQSFSLFTMHADANGQVVINPKSYQTLSTSFKLDLRDTLLISESGFADGHGYGIHYTRAKLPDMFKNYYARAKASLASASNLSITLVSVEHDWVLSNKQKGMRIHFTATANNLYDVPIWFGAFFYYKNGSPIKGSNRAFLSPTGQLTVQVTDHSSFDNTIWKDGVLEIPYSAIPGGKYDAYLNVTIGIALSGYSQIAVNSSTTSSFSRN